MYESLIDPTESFFEKLLLHEFTEVCTYHNCMVDEKNEMMMPIWEEFLAFELEHLRIAAELFKKYEKRDPEEVIGEDIIHPCHFTSQKNYIGEILKTQIDKRLGTEKDFAYIKDLPKDWASYAIQEKVGQDGAPTEKTMELILTLDGEDIVCASPSLEKSFCSLMEKGLQDKAQAPDTVEASSYNRCQ